MAKSSTTHGKYKGIIVSRTNILKIRRRLQNRMSDITDFLILRFQQIGEECIRIARESGNYNDITGNLRSSIGYVILHDGKPVQWGTPKQYKGKDGNGEDGPQAAEQLLNRLTAKYPWGVVLIICAGMKYAAYVEAVHHKDVLTSAELKCESLARQLLNNMVDFD